MVQSHKDPIIWQLRWIFDSQITSQKVKLWIGIDANDAIRIHFHSPCPNQTQISTLILIVNRATETTNELSHRCLLNYIIFTVIIRNLYKYKIKVPCWSRTVSIWIMRWNYTNANVNDPFVQSIVLKEVTAFIRHPISIFSD